MQLMATNMSQEADLLWANFKRIRNKRRRAVREQRTEKGESYEHHTNEEKSDKTGKEANADGRDGDTAMNNSLDRNTQGGAKDEVCDNATGPSSIDDREKLCDVCHQAGIDVNGEMVVCNASGACFHVSCLPELPTQILDGPFICSQIVNGLEEWQRPRAPGLKDNLQLTLASRPCGICKQRKEETPVRNCTGCYTRYHVSCLGESAQAHMNTEDKCWLCSNCQGLLKPPEHRAQMLRALVRRELVYECRRLIHLYVGLPIARPGPPSIVFLGCAVPLEDDYFN